MKQLLELNLNKTGIKYLPSSIEHASNLFEIDLWYCKILRTLPSGICKLKHIKTLSLSGCSRLDKLADNLGEMECLKMFCARDTALKELPSSIEHLTSLDSIDMSNCKSLTSLPETICHLKYLKTLTLSGCSKLDNLPENLGDMECLEELHVDGTAITEPPSSIGHLKNLKILSFRGCKEIAHWYDCICWNSKGLMLPSLSGLGLLKELDLSGCNMFDGALPNDIGNLPSLEELILSGNNFVKLPESINGLSRLEVLVLEGCKNLEALPKLPSNIAQLHADECQSLKSVGDLSTKDKLVSVSFTNCLN
uniref:Putative TMV resistance protein N-like isoform X3 n=1 Tax=Davidia involucrata TaxID=16924 RepID=A0A5B6YS99_DAVIN